MGECIISRASNGSDTSSSGPGAIAYYNNGQFVVPKTGTYHVEAVGGGKGGSGGWTYASTFGKTSVGGGTRGYYNQIYINLNKGDIININIGTGGNHGDVSYNGYSQIANGNNGGTTFVGNFLSAFGGNGDTYATLIRNEINSAWSYYENYIDPGYDIPRDYNNGAYGRGGSTGWGGSSASSTLHHIVGGDGTSGMVYISWQ